MKSVFAPANEPAPQSAPEAPESSASRAPLAPPSRTSPQPGAQQELEERLFTAMDRAALYFLQILDDTTKKDDGSPTYDLGIRMKTFDKALEYMAKRERFRPQEGTKDDEGIEMMRSQMADPMVMVDRVLDDTKCRAELERRGWLAPPPPRPSGRPTQAAAQARRRYEARANGAEPASDADDASELMAKLGMDPH